MLSSTKTLIRCVCKECDMFKGGKCYCLVLSGYIEGCSTICRDEDINFSQHVLEVE